MLTLPGGYEQRLDLGDSQDTDLPEMRLRAGAIVPMGPVMQHTAEKPLDPLTLVVSLDGRGQAAGDLYEDSGDGWGFRDGQFALSHYTASREGERVTVRRASIEGKSIPLGRRLEVRVFLDGKEFKGAGSDGTDVIVPLTK